VVEIIERAADRRHRGRDDGLVERRQQHGDEDPDDDRSHFGMAERRRNDGV
jgi:hypothetical protein